MLMFLNMTRGVNFGGGNLKKYWKLMFMFHVVKVPGYYIDDFCCDAAGAAVHQGTLKSMQCHGGHTCSQHVS